MPELGEARAAATAERAAKAPPAALWVSNAGPGSGTASGALAVRLEAVHKAFGDIVAVDGVDLEVQDGEFFSLLGPSGSGKTTMLRMIAGFERPTSGRVWLAGRDVTNLPPYDRDVNTVFQDYALFPHMSVRENVGYGLMVRKRSEEHTSELQSQ